MEQHAKERMTTQNSRNDINPFNIADVTLKQVQELAPRPTKLEETGLSEAFLADLVGKHLLDGGVLSMVSFLSPHRWLLDGFRTVLPGVEIEIVEAAAGLAAYIPDSDRTPIVGRVPDMDHLYVAVPTTNGFLLSGLMSSLLADYLTTGKEDPMLLHMRPDRPICGT